MLGGVSFCLDSRRNLNHLIPLTDRETVSKTVEEELMKMYDAYREMLTLQARNS